MSLGAGVAYVHSFASELAVMRATVRRLESDINTMDMDTSTALRDRQGDLKELRKKVNSIDRQVAMLCAKLIGSDCSK